MYLVGLWSIVRYLDISHCLSVCLWGHFGIHTSISVSVSMSLHCPYICWYVYMFVGMFVYPYIHLHILGHPGISVFVSTSICPYVHPLCVKNCITRFVIPVDQHYFWSYVVTCKAGMGTLCILGSDFSALLLCAGPGNQQMCAQTCVLETKL